MTVASDLVNYIWSRGRVAQWVWGLAGDGEVAKSIPAAHGTFLVREAALSSNPGRATWSWLPTLIQSLFYL